MNTVVAFVCLELLVIATSKVSFCSGSTYVGCVESEREALLRFKQDVKDPSNRLASWVADGDCCKWVGVVCNNLTGHVLNLRLRSPLAGTDENRTILIGKINPSLADLKYVNYLDLSRNGFEGPIPPSLGELSFLKYLDLSDNKLNGSIPYSLGKLSLLINLDLSNNEFTGPIPSSLGELLDLKELWLSANNLNGPIPLSFGKLPLLKYVDVSYNKLNGTLSEIHFMNLTRLMHFYAQGNSLHLKVSPNWIPPFQLHSLYMGSCHLGPQFPSWIFFQTNLSYLDISNSGIEGAIPSKFWGFSSQLLYLNLSHNQIHEKIPNLTTTQFRASFDFSSNNFSGPLPRVSSNVTRLDLSNNELSGSIYQFLCDEKNVSKGMKILNLRNNSLSGELPDCWVSWELLEAVYLDNNKFVGNFPISMGTLSNLASLHLRKNNFSGTIPASFGNCTELVVLDLGENELTGNVPTWIGKFFSKMIILNLRSNKFNGPLPLELCRLDSLQILDLASNNLSGTIPRCLNNFSAMVTVDYSVGNNIGHFVDFTGGITEDALLIMKGIGMEFKNTLNLVRIIDLSDNNFSGEIPIEVTNLKALQSLNLSHNFLVGRIPESIGVMTSLEAIDFSANHLSGQIPRSFSELTFLSYLNLSNNNLVGEIPSSTQLQSLDASSYIGNDLCGPPLPKSCSISTIPDETGQDETDDEHEREVDWFYVSMALGFVVGFWCIIGPLIVNRRWRYTYSLFLDHLVNKLCCFMK